MTQFGVIFRLNTLQNTFFYELTNSQTKDATHS